jgi:hypothetical protein
MMFKAFHAMGLNPQGSTAEELDKWITNYSIKKEQKPTVGHSLTLPTTTESARFQLYFLCCLALLGITSHVTNVKHQMYKSTILIHKCTK